MTTEPGTDPSAGPERVAGARARETPEDETRVMRMEVEFAAAERLTFFSDAVVAIAITLLALDLPVPGGNSTHMLREMHEHFFEYLAFLISFMVIGSHWIGHHRVFRYLRRLGGRLLALNMVWLLMMVITPFATRVLTSKAPGFVTQFSLYSGVQAVASLCFALMVREMARHDLVRPGTPRAVFANTYRRSGVMAVVFMLSIPLSLLGRWAFAFWALVPLTLRISRKILAHRHPAGNDA